ncbi:hypothetical protein [Methylophaga sp. OBS4]|uniref:hypothetical protein n=1 Tax=Methylophaga sp. OBS4 TaxID=2991935 RepID=UPI002251FFFB|nr:hypothetical protein [Methylophaga sp. OBS4]MCX4188090.1 hypothetical protein [Methylophaga sp. OBS4]
MKIWFIGLCCLFSQALAANNSIHTITLKHRLASEVLPHIEAFLPANATARAYGDMLILKADNATVANVEALLKKLDVPLQSLNITVLRTNQQLGNRYKARDKITLETGEDIDGAVAIRRWSSRDSRHQDQQYRARGIAGQPVSISMGQDIARQQHLVFIRPRGGVGVQSHTDYISTENGFQAIPVLLPDNQVRVEIHPFFSKMSHGTDTINHSDVITTVVGQLGAWLEIGYVSEDAEHAGDGFTQYRSHSSQQQIIYLKVETSSN